METNDSPIDNVAMLGKKRGGRKPGSKNKPKIATDIQKAASEAIELGADISVLRGQIADMQGVVANCCILLQQAMSLRIGAMDSESRVQDISKQRTQLEQEAHARLRSML